MAVSTSPWPHDIGTWIRIDRDTSLHLVNTDNSIVSLNLQRKLGKPNLRHILSSHSYKSAVTFAIELITKFCKDGMIVTS